MNITSNQDPLPQLLGQAGWAQRLARALVGGDADAADDLVQEAWIAAWRRPPHLTGPLRPWLGTVLRRFHGRTSRSERRRATREQDATTAGAAVTAIEPSDRLLERLEAQRCLATLVTGLDEPFRQTVLLRFYEGLTAAEIARREGVPAGTVRWRLKTGLDRLRLALDQGEGGRTHWLPLLAPLTPAEAGGGPAFGLRRPTTVAVGLLTGGLFAALGALLCQARVAPPPGPPIDPERPGATTASPSPRSSFAALATTRGCADAIPALRQEVAARETEAFRLLPRPELFERGTPNPAATRNVGPALAQLMSIGGRPPAYTLECRTWICRMALAKTPSEVERTREWQLPLQRDPQMKALFAYSGFVDRGAVRDPVSGVVLDRDDVHLTLRNREGRPARTGEDGPISDLDLSAPVPTGQLCERHREELRVRLAAATADVERNLRSDLLYPRGTPNASLTREVTAVVMPLLAGQPATGIEIDCRGLVCRIVVRGLGPNWNHSVLPTPAFQALVGGQMTVGPEIYAIMKSPEERIAAAWITRQRDAFVASRALAACNARHPSQGQLTVRLELPAARADSLTAARAFDIVHKGSLVDTPISECVDRALESTLFAAAPVNGARARTTLRLQFPLVSAPAGQ